MRNWPLRLKITLWVVLVGTIALLLFGGVIGSNIHRAMVAELDNALRHQAEDFFHSLADRGETVDWKNETQVREVFSSVRSLFAIEIEEPPGTLVYRSRNLGVSTIPPGPDFSPITATVGEKQARVLQTLRRGTVLRIAADLGPTLETDRSLLFSFAVMLPITILVMAIGGNWLSRKAMRQVSDIAAATEHVNAQRLNERLPVPGTDDEIGRLTKVLNAMMDRIQEGFEQARRFSADASHELKTPLTILRGEIEGALRTGELSPAIERTMLNIHEETGRLMYLVEGLLLLSQADSRKLSLSLQSLDLSQLIAEITDDMEILAGPDNIVLETRIAPSLHVEGDPQFLRQVLLNLFDNAVKYNIANGRISTELSRKNGTIVFTISNTGPGIPLEERDHIFRRFHRAEKSRDRRTGGQGLGLSISLEIIRAHNGDIGLVDSIPGMTVFKITLPEASTSGPPQR